MLVSSYFFGVNYVFIWALRRRPEEGNFGKTMEITFFAYFKN